MKYYRDLQPDETLQAGDEIYSGREWIPIAEQSVGVVLSGRELLLFRRPVDLPMLQRVTPEAIAELEGREIRTIAVLSQGSAKTMLWNTEYRRWCSNSGFDSPLEWQWFIDLTTIPEVQQ